jgi:hypothetical protein
MSDLCSQVLTNLLSLTTEHFFVLVSLQIFGCEVLFEVLLHLSTEKEPVSRQYLSNLLCVKMLHKFPFQFLLPLWCVHIWHMITASTIHAFCVPILCEMGLLLSLKITDLLNVLAKLDDLGSCKNSAIHHMCNLVCNLYCHCGQQIRWIREMITL